jgi:hypothetical protein
MNLWQLEQEQFVFLSFLRQELHLPDVPVPGSEDSADV